MGISSSKSTSKTNQNQTQNEVTSGTQMPVTPQWLQDIAQDYVGRIGDFGDMDPNSFVAPASPLQRMGWQNADQLGGWRGQMATASQMAQQGGSGGPNLAGNANTYNPASYNAPQLGSPSLVSGQGYQAPQLGNASTYAAARTGAPIGASQVNIAPTANAQSASLLDNLAAYKSPYSQDVVRTSLADFDYGGEQQKAALAAAGARNGAFGGSRFGIAEGQLGADLTRGRASLAAGLRDQAFNTAAGLSQSDAANRQQASMFNAGNENARALAQAGFNQQTGLFNAGEANRFALDQAGREDVASQFGAGAQNQFGLAQAGLSADALRYGADAANQSQLFNAGAQNQFGLAQGQFAADAGQFNANAANQAGMFNAGAQNDMARFNAGQMDQDAMRQLQGAGLLGNLANDYGAGTRADLGTMAALGDQQRQIEQQYALAPLAQLEAMGQLSGMTPYDILVGRQIDGTSNMTGTMQGTNVTKSSPSLFNQLLAAGQVASAFASDRRVKRDIERIDTLPNGLGLYRYRYAWDVDERPLRTGVMADEVAKIVPEALGPHFAGFQTVNYSKLGLAHLVEA